MIKERNETLEKQFADVAEVQAGKSGIVLTAYVEKFKKEYQEDKREL